MNAKTPIGNDPFVATPTGQALGDKVELASAAHAHHLSTYNDKDLELTLAKVERLVKGARGKLDDKALQELLASNGIPAEYATAALAKAKEIEGAKNFDVLGSIGLAVKDLGPTTAALAHGVTPGQTPAQTHAGILRSILGI